MFMLLDLRPQIHSVEAGGMGEWFTLVPVHATKDIISQAIPTRASS